ncbi:MAG: transcription antitermination factor NusB [Ruminococcaceae bacterium]|nr:transcription antitermination factor NusB [Oscillospiraceae bacterium]
MTRREARELAFILLFEKMFTDASMDEILEAAREARDVEVDAFASRLAVGAAEKLDELDDAITPALHNWSRERLSRVALTVLRLAVHEMQSEADNPTSVVINEAVELAKKYGGADDASFVNGVLGTLARA